MELNHIIVEYLRELLTKWPTVSKKKKLYLDEFKPELLEQAVRKAIRDVPFYHDYARYLEGGFDLTRFPIISKQDIKGKTESMVSRRVPRMFRFMKRTSGSTGIPLDVYYSPKVFIEKDLIYQRHFSTFGKNLRIAQLRDHTDTGELVQYIGNKRYLFSPYFLCEERLDEYLDEMKRLRINCLHVYPSAITIFARLIKRRYGTSPLQIKGIVASSEAFCAEDKKLVMEVFPTAGLIDNYGHNELACMAAAEGLGPFRFYHNFGYAELIDTGERTLGGNAVCEVVATSIMNTAMPLIRYATRDYVEVAPDGRVLAVLGRSSDFIVTKAGKLIPCLFLTRKESTANVVNRQYWQPAPGRLVTRLVVNDRWGEADRISMLEDMQRSFKDMLDCDVVAVDSIEKDARGKQRRLRQDVDLTPYR